MEETIKAETERILREFIQKDAKEGSNPEVISAVLTDEEPDKKPEKFKPNWSRSWYSSNPGYLQSSHMTREERFPLIYDSAKTLYPEAKRILSFGCSSGEEVQSLAKRFPEAEIVGVDLDWYSIQKARRNNKSDKVFFHTEVGATGKYDLITALMVFFCMEEPIPKDRFVDSLKLLDKHLNVDGVLMIFTSDYDPKEILGDSYSDLRVWKRTHNKNSKLYFNGYYKKRANIVLPPSPEVEVKNEQN